MRANVALETVLVHFMMLEGLRPMEIAVTMAAAESFDVTVRQKVPFELIRPREFTHATKVTAEWALEPLRQVMDQHVSSQSIFPFESGRAMRTGKGCLLTVYQFMIGQVLLGFESLAAILAGESCRRRMGLEVTT